MVFLYVFALGAIGVTYVCIQNAKHEVKVSHSIEPGIDLYGTYNQNDLLVNELVEMYNDVEVKIPK